METIGSIIQLLVGAITSHTPNGLKPFGWSNTAANTNISEFFKIENPNSVPSMRKCCTIGLESPSKTGIGGTSVLDVTKIITEHAYGGTNTTNPISIDEVGHIYTKHGGIVDIAHARDHADLTRYIAHYAKKHLLAGGGILKLPDESGERVITFKSGNEQVSPYNVALIAANISYEVSVWHEINTYKNDNTFFPQHYSSFSPEDNFSNLLGCYIGYKAILDTKNEFNLAVSIQFLKVLKKLLSSPSNEVSEKAIKYVEDHWYKYSWGTLTLLRRHFDYSPQVEPWLVTDVNLTNNKKAKMLKELKEVFKKPKPISIHIPDGIDFNKYYSFQIKKPDVEFDYTFSNTDANGNTYINSDKFNLVVDYIKNEVVSQDPKAAQPD